MGQRNSSICDQQTHCDARRDIAECLGVSVDEALAPKQADAGPTLIDKEHFIDFVPAEPQGRGATPIAVTMETSSQGSPRSKQSESPGFDTQSDKASSRSESWQKVKDCVSKFRIAAKSGISYTEYDTEAPILKSSSKLFLNEDATIMRLSLDDSTMNWLQPSQSSENIREVALHSVNALDYRGLRKQSPKSNLLQAVGSEERGRKLSVFILTNERNFGMVFNDEATTETCRMALQVLSDVARKKQAVQVQ